MSMTVYWYFYSWFWSTQRHIHYKHTCLFTL